MNLDCFGIETLKILQQPDTYKQLEVKSASLEKGITRVAPKTNTQIIISRIASLLAVYFSDNAVIDYETARQADTAFFGRFFHHLLSEGIYWPPSQFEAAFISLAHSDDEIQFTVRAIDKAIGSL